MLIYSKKMTKKCTKCYIEKQLFEFYKLNNGKHGVGSCCRQCSKQYYIENKEHIKKNDKQYYQDNKENIKKRHKQYQLNNREYFLEYYKQHYIDNRIYYKERNKKWKLDNPKYDKQYYMYNSDKFKTKYHKRRSLKKNQLGYLPDNYLALLKQLYYPNCKYCNINIEDNYHIDHIYPLSKGGLHDIDNLQLICSYCNLSKYNRLEEDFIRDIGKNNMMINLY